MVSDIRSSLPVYVDAVAPSLLASGDVVQVPVQLVNTTDKAYRGTLSLSAEGVKLERPTRSVTVPAGGSVVERVSVTATRPTQARLRAALTGADAVEKAQSVVSTGKPGMVEQGGTLAGPRQVTLSLPSTIEEGSASVRLTVTPGALALVRSEFAAAPRRTTPDDDAYLLLIAGEAPELTKTLGGTADEEALKRRRLLATQRALRHARSPSPEVAARFAPGALAHDDPLLRRLGERLAAQVAGAQRPDGTFFGQRGWPLQRVVVATAEGLRVLMAHQAASTEPLSSVTRARLQAGVAFARFLLQIKDGYTAAAVLSSGAELPPESEAKLLKLVVDQLTKHSDGSRSLTVPTSSQRPFGGRPDRVEATALAALAIGRVGDDEAQALLPDLGATLLAAYRPYRGFGDGVTNRVALEAVQQLFRKPLPDRIKVTLKRGDEVLSEQQLEGKRLSERVSLVAPLSGAPSGQQAFTVQAIRRYPASATSCSSAGPSRGPRRPPAARSTSTRTEASCAWAARPT